MSERVSDETSGGWAPLSLEHDAAAARLLADCAALGSPAAASEALAALRRHPDGELYGWIADGHLIAVYGIQRGSLHYDLLWLAVDPAWRGQRYGRSAMTDALRRVGRKPLTVEADEATTGWFQRLGFRIVGRRPLPEGGVRYRLGWYAPRRAGEPGHGAHG